MKTLSILLITLAFATTTSAATPFLYDADLNPTASNGRVIINGFNDTDATYVSNVHHFVYTPNASGFVQSPGVNAFAGSGLPSGQPLRFDVVRHLARWDGNGAVSFKPTPNETLRLTFGASTTIVAGNTDTVPGFSLGNVSSSGSMHRHLNAFLEKGSGPVADGLYFAGLRLSINGLAHSDTVYIAYNRNLSPQDVQRGMTYLADPTPGDANFDGQVNFDDLLTLAQNYGSTGNNDWFIGDFNRDRAVGFDDLLALAQNYGTGATAAIAQFQSLIVPEPATMSIALMALARRRQRR